MLEISAEVTRNLRKVLGIFKTVVRELIHVVIVWLFQQRINGSRKVYLGLEEFVSGKLRFEVQLLLGWHPEVISLDRGLTNRYLSFGHD